MNSVSGLLYLLVIVCVRLRAIIPIACKDLLPLEDVLDSNSNHLPTTLSFYVEEPCVLAWSIVLAVDVEGLAWVPRTVDTSG